MRIAIRKSDKRIIEMQSGGKVERLPREHESFKLDDDYEKYLADCDALETMRLNTLRQNAANQGYSEAEIDVRWVDEAGYAQALAEDPVEIAAKQAAIDKEAAQAAKIIAISDAKAAIASLVPAVDKATDIEGLKKVVLVLIKNVQAITA
jgi:hypothetical protein